MYTSDEAPFIHRQPLLIPYGSKSAQAVASERELNMRGDRAKSFDRDAVGSRRILGQDHLLSWKPFDYCVQNVAGANPAGGPPVSLRQPAWRSLGKARHERPCPRANASLD